MTVRNTLLGALAAALTCLGPALAEERLSTSTDPDGAIEAPLDAQLLALFGQERAALDRARPRLRAAAARAPKPRPETIDADWLARRPVPAGDAQFECLARALYFEARGEPVEGQVAVAEVVLNRVESPRYPATICEVVNEARRSSCQFSFMCDGKPETVSNPEAWARAAKIARAMIDGAPRRLTGGATHFHAGFVRPGWSGVFTRTAEIGGHLFYRPDRVTRSE